MKMRLVIFLVAILAITACTKDFAPLRDEQKYNENYQELKKTELQNEFKADKVITEEPSEIVQPVTQPKVKLTEAKCKEAWKPLIELKTPLLVLEERYIMATFRSEVSFQKAKEILKENNANFEKIIEIFPLGKEATDESKYNAYRRIKAKVMKDKEIEIACKLLQESEIDDATPAITIDFQSLVNAAQQ